MAGHVRGADFKARADNGVFDNLSEMAKHSPTLELQNKTMRILGKRITTVSFVGYRPSLDFLRTGAMSAYLVDFTRRQGPVYLTGIPAATALFATLLSQVDGRYDFLKGLVILETLIAKGSDSAAMDDETTHVWLPVPSRLMFDGRLLCLYWGMLRARDWGSEGPFASKANLDLVEMYLTWHGIPLWNLYEILID